MSTIKVDTIATRTGSGNITASNTIAGTSATLSGTLNVTGTAALAGDATANRLNLGGRSAGAGGTPLGVNFSSASTNGMQINDTNSGNLGGMLGFYSGSGTGTLRANIQNANNAGVHMCVGTGGSVVFTQTGYTAANALDDYEEGTFTPSFTNGVNAGATYTAQSGRYTKIGRQVITEVDLDLNSFSANGSHVYVGGFPFVSNSAAPYGGGFFNYNGGWYNNIGQWLMIAGAQYAAFYRQTDGAALGGTSTGMSMGGTCRFVLLYMTA